MKKINLLLMISVLIFSTVLLIPQNAQAVVASKVASTVAKKAAKELIKDAAVNSAINMTIEFHMDLTDKQKHKALESGYDAVCFKKENNVCTKPAQIKKDMTPTDKTKLAKTVETVLDRKVGMTGWMKFLDWFVPIFLVGGAITWLMTKLDSDTEDLFDQVAKESLNESGMILPLEPLNPTHTPSKIVDDNGNPIQLPTPIKVENPPNALPELVDAHEFIFNVKGQSSRSLELTLMNAMDKILVMEVAYSDMERHKNAYYTSTVYDMGNQYQYASAIQIDEDGVLRAFKPIGKIDLYKNGELIYSEQSGSGSVVNNYRSSQIKKDFIKKHIIEFNKNGVNMFVTTQSGDEYALKTDNNYFSTKNLKIYSNMQHGQDLNDTSGALKISLYKNGIVDFKPYAPYFPKPQDININTIDHSIYKKSEGVQIIPPSVVPIKTPTGVPVKPDGNGGWKDQITDDPITVDEDTLIVEDPVRTPGDDGFTIPGGSIPDPKPNDQTDPEPNPDPDNSCERIKKPDFKPLTTAVTTSFPFSIPWDLARMFNSAFSGIGDERPAFNYSFEFNGQVKEWNIEIPKFFDNWTAFTRPLLVIIFDAGLIYAMYRFTKGGD